MGSAVKFQQFNLATVEAVEPANPTSAAVHGNPVDDDPPPTEREQDRLDLLAQLAGSLSAIAAGQDRLRDDLICATAQALGAAAEAILPALARKAFAARIAELTTEVARRAQWPNLTLTLAPGDRADVDEALATHDAVAGLTIAEDGRIGPGEAQLAWAAGGARIDVDAIATAALDDFRQRLDGLASKGD